MLMLTLLNTEINILTNIVKRGRHNLWGLQ